MFKKICVICLLWLPFSLFAVELEGLYRYEVPVQGQSSVEREQAIKKALAGVLEKVSGDSGAADSSQFSSAYRQAGRFVLRYRYLVLEDELLLEEGYRQILRVDFDEEAVRRLFSRSDFSVLGDSQLTTLVRLTITKVSSVEDYAYVTHYLESLSEVAYVQVEEVGSGNIVLQLSIRGDISGFVRTINLGDTMTPVNSRYLTGYGAMPSDFSEEDAELTYRLIE